MFVIGQALYKSMVPASFFPMLLEILRNLMTVRNDLFAEHVPVINPNIKVRVCVCVCVYIYVYICIYTYMYIYTCV